jgi:hypothetical protein
MKKKTEEIKNGAAQPERKTIVFEVWQAACSRIVKWLDRNTADYSKTKAVVTLTVFSAGVILILFWIAVKGFYSTEKEASRQEGLSRNVLSKFEERAIVPDGTEIAKRLSKGREFLDSLANNPTLRYKYDSLVAVRPGLIDSLNTAENYYKH